MFTILGILKNSREIEAISKSEITDRLIPTLNSIN